MSIDLPQVIKNAKNDIGVLAEAAQLLPRAKKAERDLTHSPFPSERIEAWNRPQKINAVVLPLHNSYVNRWLLNNATGLSLLRGINKSLADDLAYWAKMATRLLGVLLLASAAVAAAGCGHSKTEVDGLKAALKQAKEENVRLHRRLSDSERSAERCASQVQTLFRDVISRLTILNYQLVEDITQHPCWIDNGLNNAATTMSISERRRRFFICLKKGLGLQ